MPDVRAEDESKAMNEQSIYYICTAVSVVAIVAGWVITVFLKAMAGKYDSPDNEK